ncbi:hypothetical protein Syun_021856 [Stephania yunnanensis]|uniref:Uncharacterized protein n=1 Tax=Stephania yunnanensis TaxID=152371 RepID=A0AAP0NR19_9MAGN
MSVVLRPEQGETRFKMDIKRIKRASTSTRASEGIRPAISVVKTRRELSGAIHKVSSTWANTSLCDNARGEGLPCLSSKQQHGLDSPPF